MNFIQAKPAPSVAGSPGASSSRETARLGRAAAASKPAAESWRNKLRRFLCGLDYMLARHQRLGWHPELDAEALEDRRRQLRAIEPGK